MKLSVKRVLAAVDRIGGAAGETVGTVIGAQMKLENNKGKPHN